MSRISWIAISLLIFSSCDPGRVYEKNIDFEKRFWAITEQPQFEFVIDDPAAKYNLYVNLRNEVSYPNANLYFTYYLTDTTGKVLEKKLVSELLFDQKTGKPLGESGLGDIYDHQVLLQRGYRFERPGKYIMRYEQFMRTDTLNGMLAVGLRVERSQ